MKNNLENLSICIMVGIMIVVSSFISSVGIKYQMFDILYKNIKN